MITATIDLEDIAQSMRGRKVDLVPIVDHILHLATEVGIVECTLANDESLKWRLGGGEYMVSNVDVAKGKLRAMCARLAVLCMENGSQNILYGGSGIIVRNTAGEESDASRNVQSPAGSWSVRTMNTTDLQEFEIKWNPN